MSVMLVFKTTARISAPESPIDLPADYCYQVLKSLIKQTFEIERFDVGSSLGSGNNFVI